MSPRASGSSSAGPGSPARLDRLDIVAVGAAAGLPRDPREEKVMPQVARRSARRSAGASSRKSAEKGRRLTQGQYAGISDEAVVERTGKGWRHWFAVLDRAGGKVLGHTKSADLLNERHGVSGWWSQMITVAWEQARGLRVKHQTPSGFEVSVSRTLAAANADAWKSFVMPARRRAWVNMAGWTVRTQKPPERLRVAVADGTTIEFRLVAKGPRKCQVVVQHLKLKDAKTAAWTKQCWARALERLKEKLSG
jgi:hypothetical protein